MLDVQKKESNWFDKLLVSGKDSFRNWFLRFLILEVFTFIIAIREFTSYLDKAVSNGGGIIPILQAIGQAFWAGVSSTLRSIWLLLLNLKEYISLNYIGSLLIIAGLSIALLVWFYQWVSPFVNAVDLEKGQATMIILRIALTMVLVFGILAPLFYYLDPTGDVLITRIGETNSSIESIGDNVTNNNISDNGSVTNNSLTNYVNLLYNNDDEGG